MKIEIFDPPLLDSSFSFGKGIYLLELKLNSDSLIKVGKLGLFTFQNGYYYYVGSAFGSGGLREG
jgi:Uri superfamily endonuclease